MGDKCWANATSLVRLAYYKQTEGRTGLTDGEVKRKSNLMGRAVGGKENHRL